MKLAKLVLVAAAAACVFAAPARAQWSIAGADGKSALKLGFLAQMQAEELKNLNAETYQQNLFLRRFRVMGGGKISERVTFFFETDVPNLGKGQSTGKKVDNTMILQDAYVTHAFCPSFGVDAGMLLVPLSHNSTQSAGSLLAPDYGPYSFVNNDSLNGKVGRDYGAMGRGWLGGRRLELRGVILQGNRGTDQRGPFRLAGRAVYYPFEADTAMFYTGTTLGKRKLVALGASVDAQRDYRTTAGDVFVDWPVAGGDGFTLQADVLKYNGGDTFAGLAEQTCVLVEAGWYFHQAKVSPFVQYAARDYDAAALHDETKLQGGLAWWGNGHRYNLKLAVAQLTRDGSDDGTQFVAQWQVLGY